MKKKFKLKSRKVALNLQRILITLTLFHLPIFALAQSPRFTSTPVENGVVDERYQYDITTKGWNFLKREIVLSDGKLPEGLKLKDFGDGTGVLKGTPKEGGNFPIELTVRFKNGDNEDDDSNDDRTVATSDKQKFTLKIAKKKATIKLDKMTTTYTGSPYTPDITTIPKGLKLTVTYNNKPNAPTDAGSYTLIATIDDKKYEGSIKGTLLIKKATAGVTLHDLDAVYDGTPKRASATTSPPNLDVKITYNNAATPPTAIGQYEVSAVITETNYKGSAKGTLVIRADESNNDGGNDGGFDDDDNNGDGGAGQDGRPVLSNLENEPIVYIQGDPPLPVSETVIINDYDDTHMYEAKILISKNYRAGEDQLHYDMLNDISGVFDPEKGLLTLSGVASRSNYEDAISNVKYNNLVMGETPILNKQITITVKDSLQYSAPVVRDVEIQIFHELDIVNAFTPNGDEVNDYWDFVNLDAYAAIAISVFDKNGKEVFRCLKEDCAWDGKYKGNLLPADVYFYAIDVNNGKRKYKGTVTILR